MLKLYHNPRCSKSRAALALLETANVEFEIVKYIDDALDTNALSDVLAQLGLDAKDVIRKGEKIFKTLELSLDDDNQKLIEAIANNPILLERPILSNGKQAVIGRPTENIANFIEQNQ